MSSTTPTSPLPPTPVPAPRVSLLRQAGFRRLWAAQSVSLAGDQITLLALPLVAVLRLGATPAQMGLLTAAGWLPHLLFSVPAGAWIDQRRHRRRILVAADLLRAAALLSVPVAAAAGTLTLVQLYAVAFTSGVLTVAFDLAYWSFVVAVVAPPDVADAHSRMSTSRAGAQVAGPGLAGWLVQLVGAPLAVVVDAVSFVGSAAFLRGIRTAEIEVEPDPEPWHRRVREGLRFVFGHRLLRRVAIACGLLNLFDMMLMAVLVLYLSRSLHLSPGVIGTLLAGGAVGALVGAVLATRVARWLGLGRTIGIGAFGLAAAPFAVAVARDGSLPTLALLLAGHVVTGIAVMLFDVNQNAVMTLVTPHRVRARSAGAMRLVAYGPRPVGALLGGVLGGWLGLPTTLAIAAVGGLSGAFVTWWSPIRRLETLPEPV